MTEDIWGRNSSISNCENVTVAIPPDAPVLDPILPNLDTDGIINLNWSDIAEATIYYVFRNTSNIISVDGLIPIAAVTDSNYTDTIIANGTYYYVIITGSVVGNSSISNCENVTIEFPPGIPGFESIIIICFFVLIVIYNERKRYKSL
ncbi:MAG: hypothetical protein ACFFD2_16970 [Promethearchaeota archaeon]